MSDTPAGDEHMGKWVYCTQHLRAHTTGWCTVSAKDKRSLEATNYEDAMAEVRANGWPIYGETENTK